MLNTIQTIADPLHEQVALTRDWIEHHTVHRYRTAGGTRPDLRVVEWNGGTVAVKDFSNSSPTFKQIVGRILVRREHLALSKLVGVAGIPQLISKVDAFALTMEHVEHIPTDSLVQDQLTSQFYQDLTQVVKNMHTRGVAHCDLRTFGNVLAGKDGKPYIVDFAACVYRGKGINPITRWLFDRFAEADDYAVLKIKKRFSPGLLTEDEIRGLAEPLPLEKAAKVIGHSIRAIVQRTASRK